jgi:uncharacterized membrane protein
MAKTSTGLEENVAGLLCYVLGWVSGIVFLVIEPENKFVRFHAMQSIVTFGVITAVSIALSVLGLIPFLGVVFNIINGIIGALAFILWIVLMVMAVQGKKYKLPWAGDKAENWLGKTKS